MKRILLIMVISLSILTAGCGLKYRSCKEMPFDQARITILDSSEIKGYLIFEEVVFKNEVLDIWANIEKAKIEIKHRPGLTGSILSIKPTFSELITAPSIFLRASEVEVICGCQEDVAKWKEAIKRAKEHLIDLRTKPRQVPPPEINK